MHAQLVAEIARPRSYHRSARCWLVVALALCATGCTKLVYNRLDTLTAWFLEGLVSLDEAQRTDLRSFLEQTLEWHRQSELARYAKFLRDLATAAAQPASRDDYERAEQLIEQFTDTVVAKTAPAAARLLMSLTPAQLDELQESLEEKSRERSAKSLQARAQGTWHQKRAKDLQRQLKRWTGTVTAEQKQLLRATAEQLEPMASDWLESQQRWRSTLRRVLDERGSPDTTRKRILRLLREPDTEWTPEYEAKSARNRERTLNLLQALDGSLTGPQRERLQRELSQLAEQLEAMTED